MTTTTGDPRIDQDERIQAWVEVARPLFTEPSKLLLQALDQIRQDLRAAGVTRWTPDLRAVLWVGLLNSLRVTTAREWQTCWQTLTDRGEHWRFHRSDNWSHAVAVLVLLDQRGL